ncbi:endonuclease [Flavobacterium sp. MEB061]|uniref:T9SS-dependent choice-of-anchor J family protein n=1 Tax=Flavobacterium sp. MEB061 TaxID=1587524 RepID=UPI0005AC9AF1|nr:T9SS type A sorting domain-containing protein [Flavobacterium sp. MEB061]KIQ14063.1 endonuclease [Flavobacterium sp. MEB061]
MKNIYSLRHLMTFLSFFCCFAIVAQTMPALSPLPYQENFENWSSTSTEFISGLKGWNLGTNATGTTEFATSSTFTDYTTILTGRGANINSGGFYNYVGKIGFLNTTNLNLALGLAFSTDGLTDVKVQYDIMTIRNPYDASNTRINEMILQYRVGSTGDFTSIAGTEYRNNTENQTGTNVFLPQNSLKRKITLPAQCNNQPVVQIRWVSKQVSGGGGRPSFAIDNIDVRSDNTAPVTVAGYPKTDNVLSSGFDFISKINESGKTYYVLLPGGSSEPTIAQIKTGQDAAGNTALQSGFVDIIDPTQEYSKTFTALSLNTAYSVFSFSEDLYDNPQITVNRVDVTTASVVDPLISTTISSLDLGFSESNYEDAIHKSYQIAAVNLTTDVVVTAPANFSISKDNNTFASSLTFTVADFASNATPTVYVKFSPNAVAGFSGQITHESTGAVTTTVSLTGTGINPYVQGFNDANVLTNSGWAQYNLAGPTNQWKHTTETRNINSGAGAVLVNGYTDTGASNDWLISPRLRLDNFVNLPLLSFYSRKFYPGPGLKLMVSTNYDGVSSPATATWTEIEGKFPTSTGNYVQSQYIKLDAYKTNHTYLAWVYETTMGGGNNNASEWSFDDFAITNEAGYVDSNPVLDFGIVLQNTVSDAQSFNFKAEGYGDITITAPASYQISADNISFGSTILVSAADALAGKILYVKFAPTVKEFKIAGALTVTGTSLNKQIGSLTGSSLPKEDTFDVVTYNLEFFGSTNNSYGPTDNLLQIENVAKVMNKLDADVYAVQEVSSDGAIDDLIQKISINGKTFAKSTSTSWSYSWDPTSDPNFPLQKLVVIYNTQTTSVKKSRVMFQGLYDELVAGTKTLVNYPLPLGTPPAKPSTGFFSSGRLPYMVTIETNVNGVKNEINLIDLHARANSGSDVTTYNRRKYDTQVLKDSLDTYYANSNIILLGDYNDDVKGSVFGVNNPSTYENFVTDSSNYKALTLEISQAGAFSFLSSGGFLDHIMISNELVDQYVNSSTAVYDPRNDIPSYTTNTSDHGPVIARFQLKQDVLSTIDFDAKKGFAQAYPNPATDIVNIVVKTTDEKNLKLKLYDISGRLVGGPIEIKGSQDSNITAVQVSNLRSGIYVYTLSENNKVVFKDKIIKK